MTRTISEILAELPPDQQEEIEQKYQALLQTLPNLQHGNLTKVVPKAKHTTPSSLHKA